MKLREIISEVSLQGFGDYAKKARFNQASNQMSAAFGNPADKEKHLHKAAQREKGLARHKTRVDKYWNEKNAKDAAEREQAIRTKFAGVDIDAEIEKLKPALQRAYHDYQYGARNTYSDARAEYHRIGAKIQELENAKKVLGETASAGTTNTAGNASLANPTIARSKGKVKSVSALDQNKVSLFGGPMESNGQAIIKRR